jgi:hypothetical protein
VRSQMRGKRTFARSAFARRKDKHIHDCAPKQFGRKLTERRPIRIKHDRARRMNPPS